VPHNFEYSWEERFKKTTFFAVVGTVSSPPSPPLPPACEEIQSFFLGSSCHTERRKTKRQGKELGILSLLAEQKEEGEFQCSKKRWVFFNHNFLFYGRT
jgi:hypothetical protein